MLIYTKTQEDENAFSHKALNICRVAYDYGLLHKIKYIKINKLEHKIITDNPGFHFLLGLKYRVVNNES